MNTQLIVVDAVINLVFVIAVAGILEAQPSEVPPIPFSYMNALTGVSMADKLIACAKTYTNEETHRCVQLV